ncbi:hypothetical protein BDW74DRAFT_178005 [Aspergillus multicolor]|uniref:uncharacterized protein n=1 Tax=Aspergillus multicolor TaxID=41759 RepID=UPI003CCD6951
MKTSPRPATVSDVNDRGDPILHSIRSAARVKIGKRHSDPLTLSRHDAKPMSTLEFGTSRCHGSVKDFVTSYDKSMTLTIFSTDKDDSDRKNAVEGACFRKIFLTDETEVLNPTAAYERQRYVKLVILISHTDEEHQNPSIYVEQKIYEDGQEQTVVNELMFASPIRTGVEYVFAKCGDEGRLLGKRDLIIRFRAIDGTVFNEYINRAKYYGYDQHQCIKVNSQNLVRGVDYAIPPPGDAPAGTPHCTGFIYGSNLTSLYASKEEIPHHCKDELFSTGGIELLKLRFDRRGKCTEDRHYIGNLIIHFVYVSLKS